MRIPISFGFHSVPTVMDAPAQSIMAIALRERRTPDGHPWTAKALSGANLGSGGTAHGLLHTQKSKRTPWNMIRLTKFKEYLEKALSELDASLVKEREKKNQSVVQLAIESLEKRILDQRALLESVESAIALGGVPKYSRDSAPPFSTLRGRGRALSPSPGAHFDFSWAASQGITALLAADFLVHGSVERLDEIVRNKSDDAVQELRLAMTRRCQSIGATLEMLVSAIHDTGDRLLAAVKANKLRSLFAIRGTVYLLVPPKVGDPAGSYRLCQILRTPGNEPSSMGKEGGGPISLNTHTSDGYVAVRAIKDNKLTVGEGLDRGTVRPWRTQLVLAHPIRVPSAVVEWDAAGVVTIDLVIRANVPSDKASKIMDSYAWADHEKTKLHDAVAKFADICSKVLVTDSAKYERPI